MNENKVPAIWKWTVILLILCNTGLIATLWVKPGMSGGRDGEHHRPERARDYVIRSLKFTDDQVNRYEELIHDHRRAMDRLRDESMELRQALFNNIKNTPGGLNADSLAQLIAGKQKEIEIVTYQHFAQVRATICTDAQKPEFDKIIGEVMKKMSGAMRGGPPPHEHDGPDGPPPGEHSERERSGDGNSPPPPNP